MPGWKSICCAIDFSEESRFAMEEAAELARSSGADLALVHVVGGRSRGGAEPPPRSTGARADPLRRLEEWRAAAERAAGRRVAAALLDGTPAAEILRFAREGRHDLVVMGTPAVLGCERTVFGSVAEGVIRRAPCTVIVARQRRD